MRWWINQTRRWRRRRRELRIGHEIRNSTTLSERKITKWSAMSLVHGERERARKNVGKPKFLFRAPELPNFLLQRQRFSNWLQWKKYPKREGRKEKNGKSQWKGFIIHLLSAPVRKYRAQPGREINIFSELSLPLVLILLIADWILCEWTQRDLQKMFPFEIITYIWFCSQFCSHFS